MLRCPRALADPYWFRSASSGAWAPPACRAWVCDFCGPRRMRRLAAANDASGVERFVTVTLADGAWRQSMHRLLFLIRAEVPGWEWAFVRERGPKTGVLHVHAVVRGDYLNKRRLRRLAVAAGLGKVADIKSAHRNAGGYAAKAAGYAAKALGGWDETLRLNDGRGWHQSRGWFLGLGARGFVSQYAPPRDRGPWVRTWKPSAMEEAAHFAESYARDVWWLDREARYDVEAADAELRATLDAVDALDPSVLE